MLDVPARFSQAEFADFVDREHEQVELKRGAGRRPLQECLVAFSNAAGGVIFIGVTDRREVIGRRRDQGLDDDIHGAAVDAHHVARYEVREILVGAVPTVAVLVQTRDDEVAATSDGRILARRGGHNRAMVGQDLRELVNARSLIRFESSDSGVALADADDDLSAEVAAAYGWGPVDQAARLRERGLLTDRSTLTIAGALLVTDPATSLGAAKFHVDIRGYESDSSSSYVRRDLVSGPAHRQVQRATEIVMRDIGTDMVVTGAHRHDLPRLPRRVVREAIANAVAHRSYELDRAPVLIELRPTVVVVVSPGRLPPPVTIESLRRDQSARNHSVIDALRRFRLAEDSGQGIDVIEDSLAMEFLDEPRFSEEGEQVRVELPLVGLVSAVERGWLAEFERTGILEPAERLLLLGVLRQNRLTNARAREVLGVDSTEVRTRLRRLRDAGLLVQHGTRGRAYYTLGAIAPRTSDEQVLLTAARSGPLTNQRVRELTGRDRIGARSLLRQLVVEGGLIQRGERRGTTYVLPRRRASSGRVSDR